MGTLWYGDRSYPLPDEDVVTLQLATSHGLNGTEGAGFTVELQWPHRTVWLMFSPGVPITFETTTAHPLHRGDAVLDSWCEAAGRSGFIEIGLD